MRSIHNPQLCDLIAEFIARYPEQRHVVFVSNEEEAEYVKSKGSFGDNWVEIAEDAVWSKANWAIGNHRPGQVLFLVGVQRWLTGWRSPHSNVSMSCTKILNHGDFNQLVSRVLQMNKGKHLIFGYDFE